MSDGTLQILDITMLDDVGTGANQLIQLDSNAKIPACSAAAVTGLSGVTKNASDPVISTNPSGGVGSVWQNTTSGEMYICTDATAGENVWINIGEGTGDITWWKVQGENYGFVTGGNPIGNGDRISKFAFASSSSGTDLANLTQARQGINGGKSSSYGYASGGEPRASYGTIIEKYAFVSTANATDVGDLSLGRSCGANSQSDGAYVYNSGGNEGPPLGERGITIDRFPVASDTNATDVGDLVEGGHSNSVAFDLTHGYHAGNYNTAPGPAQHASDTIQRFAFASSGNATDVGNLFTARFSGEGSSSLTHGYMCAGANGASAWTNTIQKYAMASSSTGTDVGDTLSNTGDGCGLMDTGYGYHVGGYPGNTNIIQRYAFASDGNAVDVGDMEAGQGFGGSTEY